VMFGVMASLVASAASVSAQTAPVPDGEDSAARIVLVKLSPPAYPAIAQQALIEGDVSVRIVVHSDGRLDSASAGTGHRLLQQAAVESAKQSKFECRACAGSDVTRAFMYSFHLLPTNAKPDPCCCARKTSSSQTEKRDTDDVSQSDDHITITTVPAPVCMCPDI